MPKVQVFMERTKKLGKEALEFFRFKTRREDFSYGLMHEFRLARVPLVLQEKRTIGGKPFTEVTYEPLRGARARV
jgi:hypothetical protein